MNIERLNIDLETYSDVDLAKCGVYKYAESPNFEIQLFGYAINGGEREQIDLACGEEIPEEILAALSDDNITKWAFNATFERICLSYWLQKHHPEYFKTYGADTDTVSNYLSPKGWKCTMVWSAYIGLPLSLAGVGAVLKLDNQKMEEGKALIKYFAVPCKPTKVNGGRTRNLPEHDMDKWNTYKEYNKRDVEVEMAIQERLRHYPVPDFVWDEYYMSEEINDRGIYLDMNVVTNAIDIDAKTKEVLLEESIKITGLENPNSVTQMMDWLESKGVTAESLDKKSIIELLKQDLPKDVRKALLLRQQLAKSSVKKYQAMLNAVCKDGRARGMFQFYGANRSGRWAGRLIQLQNLPQNHMIDLEEARTLVSQGDYETLNLLYDNVPNVLSELIRTAFVPRPGYKFCVADFSAIEARVLAYLAGEKWRIKTFADGKDIYCASASQMFGVPVEKNGVNGHLRQKGKIAELALGYGGSVGALTSMGALDMGLEESELQPLVNAWRDANPNIVNFWWAIDRAIKLAIKQHLSTTTYGLRITYKSGMLFITLPSGRNLCYVKPKIGENKFGGESITYEGVGTQKKWERIESYGPKFVENITQAISRDILAYAMKTLYGCYIVGHVHDELIIECPMDTNLDDICEKMGQTPEWVKDLLLRADGYECQFYKKD